MSHSCPLLSDAILAARGHRELLLKIEIYRFLTFGSFPRGNKPYTTRLAQAGFYYTQNGDEVVCYVCALRKHGWSGEDDPIEIHRSLSPDCPFLLQNAVVDIQETYVDIQGNQMQQQSQNQLIRHERTHDELGSLQPRHGNQNIHFSRQVSNPVFCDYSGLVMAKYPMYTFMMERVASFHKSGRFALNPRILAEAGFFYTGFGDYVRCFQCGIGLRHWSADDDAWIEHLRWSKDCLFVKQLRGLNVSNFVQRMPAQYSDNSLVEQQVSRNSSGHWNNRNDNSIEDMTALFEDNQRMIDRHYCILCRMVLRSVVFLNCPTPHLLTCHTCAVYYDRCPLCNTVIKALLYLPR